MFQHGRSIATKIMIAARAIVQGAGKAILSRSVSKKLDSPRKIIEINCPPIFIMIQ